MKRILIALVVLLLVLSPLTFAQVVEEETLSNVEITEEMMKEATPAEEGTITIEIAKREEELKPWRKYAYLNMSQDLNNDRQTLWARVGMRKGSLDLSIGWSQIFQDPEREFADKGRVSLSASWRW